MDVNRSNPKLFRAIVILGAAMTSSACFDENCPKCVRVDAPVDSVETRDARVADAPTDEGGTPKDAPVDVVLIL